MIHISVLILDKASSGQTCNNVDNYIIKNCQLENHGGSEGRRYSSLLYYIFPLYIKLTQEGLRTIISLRASVIFEDAVRWVFLRKGKRKFWQVKGYKGWVGIWGSVCRGVTGE